MALNLSQYVDPGVYVGEVIVPGSATATTSPLTVCLIGTGVRTKRATNEAVVRGLVQSETLSFVNNSQLGNEYAAELDYIANRRASQLTVAKDGIELDPSTYSFGSAYVVGTVSAAVDLTTNKYISLSLDGKQPVVIMVSAGAADATTISDDSNLIDQVVNSTTISNIASVSMSSVAYAINKALAGAESLGYGSAYAAVASVSGGKLAVKSPLSNQYSDVKVYPAFYRSATAAVFGAGSIAASTYVVLSEDEYSVGSVYTARYIASDTTVDALANENVNSLIKVGNYAGVTSYAAGIDYTLSNDSIEWNVLTPESVSSKTGPFDLSAGTVIKLSLDGKSSITIDLADTSKPGASALSANPTASELKNNINAALADARQYGPQYANAATESGGVLKISSILVGAASTIEIDSTPAAAEILAVSLQSGPYNKYGSGGKPASGLIYFATYEYTRPVSDYNALKRYYTADSLYADIGYPSAKNKLALAAGICFDNGAPSVMVVQVNDQNFIGTPTRSEVKAALDASSLSSAATEICVLDTRESVRADLVQHVADQCSPVEKNWRRGWFGMPRDTEVGDRDTPGTFVYTASRGLSVPADSPARGRMVLVAPGSATRQVTTESGLVQDVDLDSSFVAAAVAARMTSFQSPSETLLRKTITGFNTDNFPVYLRAERAALASNGVTVVTLDAGRLVLTDPVTTEDGSGKLATFREISASTQKDAVVQAVTNIVDSNLVGIVPSDMGAFLLTVKSYIANALSSLINSGAIAPFKDGNNSRDIDISQDIQVMQDKSDPTKFAFKFYFNLRLPAKRFLGEYSVNNPFFG